jgi:hypothetical protein
VKDEDMSEAKRARMGVAAPLMWDQFVEENKEDDFFFTGGHGLQKSKEVFRDPNRL